MFTLVVTKVRPEPEPKLGQLRARTNPNPILLTPMLIATLAGHDFRLGRILGQVVYFDVLRLWVVSFRLIFKRALFVVMRGESTVKVSNELCRLLIVVLFVDVLGLSWSPDSTYLASCSIDNTIIIWNALKFPGAFPHVFHRISFFYSYYIIMSIF